jgi:hypothetical protein
MIRNHRWKSLISQLGYLFDKSLGHGESGSASATGGLQAVHQTPEIASPRSCLLGMPFSALARMAICIGNRPARYDHAPKYLLRDNDSIYGEAFRQRVKSLGIQEVRTAYRSPWQNPFVERLIGSVRRECLDHVIVLSERHLKRILREYFDYYNHARAHMSLNGNAPLPREVEPSDRGQRLRSSVGFSLPHKDLRCLAVHTFIY